MLIAKEFLLKAECVLALGRRLELVVYSSPIEDGTTFVLVAHSPKVRELMQQRFGEGYEIAIPLWRFFNSTWYLTEEEEEQLENAICEYIEELARCRTLNTFDERFFKAEKKLTKLIYER